MTRIEVVQPELWPRPSGYANGVAVQGRTLYVGGQIGWDANHEFPHTDFVGQFAQTLDNIIAVVRAAGGGPSDVAKMTVYVTDLDAYRASVGSLGPIWRARFGTHYPAMALLGVAGLVHPAALVEIEAIAAVP